MNKNHIYLLIGFILGLILYKIFKRSKNSNYSNFTNVAVYNFSNTTSQPKTVKLFSSVYSPPSGVSILPTTIDLQAEVLNIPKQVGNIRIRSSNVNQIESPITYKCQTPTGTGNSQIINPRVSPTQAQSNVVDAPVSNILLDGRCFFEYTILPNTEVTWSISYNDLQPQYQTEQSLKSEEIPVKQQPLPLEVQETENKKNNNFFTGNNFIIVLLIIIVLITSTRKN